MWGAYMGEHMGGLLWRVDVGVNIPKYCETVHSHLKQRAFPDSSGLVLHPGDVWEVPGYFYPSYKSGAQGAGKPKWLFSCSPRGGKNPNVGDLYEVCTIFW